MTAELIGGPRDGDILEIPCMQNEIRFVKYTSLVTPVWDDNPPLASYKPLQTYSYRFLSRVDENRIKMLYAPILNSLRK